jgi:hypothetical protein
VLRRGCQVAPEAWKFRLPESVDLIACEYDALNLVPRKPDLSRHDRAWSEVEWFTREGPRWRRRHEPVSEVCWSSGEIRRTLLAAGFDRLRAWDAAPFFKDNPLVLRGCRTVYLARKASA